MPQQAATEPVKDTVAKVDNEVAVGEDLEFQRKWWKFERAMWIVFVILIALDLAGAFGRGPLAKATAHAADHSLNIRYERIERTSTPSILRIDFGPSAIHDGVIKLFVSEDLTTSLGAQRVIPSPQTTTVGRNGLTYTFPASGLPASVEFALEPTGPGVHHVTLQSEGSPAVTLHIVTVP